MPDRSEYKQKFMFFLVLLYGNVLQEGKGQGGGIIIHIKVIGVSIIITCSVSPFCHYGNLVDKGVKRRKMANKKISMDKM